MVLSGDNTPSVSAAVSAEAEDPEGITAGVLSFLGVARVPGSVG
jgi:hypothetical protein